MKVLFNHGLSIEELYTNTPKRIIDRKWIWFIKHGGSKATYEDSISDPFKFFIHLVVNKVIDDKVRFKIPIIGEAYLDFEVVNEEKFETHRQYGRFQEIDFISSDFTGYAIRYNFKIRGNPMSFQLYLGGHLKQKFLDKINEGTKFYSTKDIGLKDLIDEAYKEFYYLKKSEVKKLIVHGFRRMHVALSHGSWVTISTSKYGNCYFFIGTLYNDVKKQVRDYVKRRDTKLRWIYRWSEKEFDGYYYIGLNPSAFNEWVKINKNNRVRLFFKDIIVRKILKEVFWRHRYMYIFRVKLKKDKGWTYRMTNKWLRDVEYMGRTIDWNFIPSKLTWKELIKLYEAGNNIDV